MNNHDRWNAKHYKKHSDPRQFQRGLRVIQQLDWHGDEHVLDVGCGDGRLTAEIATRVPKGLVLGVDISTNMINEAITCFGEIKNLSFQQADIATWSTQKKFNRAVSFAAFHWIKDQVQALKTIYHVLLPGGSLVMIMDAGGSRSINNVLTSAKWAPLVTSRNETYHPQGETSMIELLKNCNFSNINVKVDGNTRVFADCDTLFNWIINWLPHATGLSVENARELAQDIVENICTDQNRIANIELEAPTLCINAVRYS